MLTGTLRGIVLIKFLMILVVSTHSVALENTIPHLGITESGHPYKGDINAPVTLVEYSDYLCPFCARHHRGANTALVEKYVKTGKLKIEFRHFLIASLPPTAVLRDPIGYSIRETDSDVNDVHWVDLMSTSLDHHYQCSCS